MVRAGLKGRALSQSLQGFRLLLLSSSTLECSSSDGRELTSQLGKYGVQTRQQMIQDCKMTGAVAPACGEKFSTPRRLDAPTVNDVNPSSSSSDAVRPCRDLGPLRRQDFLRSPLNLPSPLSDWREERSEDGGQGGCGISHLRSYQYLNAHLVQSLSRNHCDT